MGIPISQARLLIREAKDRPYSGAILQLGKQNMGFTLASLQKVAAEEGFALRETRRAGEIDARTSNNEFDDIQFFHSLGFESVTSLDINDFEGATFVHDLNVQITDDSVHFQKYDLIFDGGTLEHVFHTPNCLINCANLVKVGGRIIHAVPVDMFNHGFYNFSATLFEDFYGVNNFLVGHVLVLKTFNYRNDVTMCTSAREGSQFIRSLCAGTFDKATHTLFVIVTKLEDSTSNRIPLQGYYSKLFGSQENLNNSGLINGNSTLKSLYQRLIKYPLIGQLAKYVRNLYAKSLVQWERI